MNRCKWIASVGLLFLLASLESFGEVLDFEMQEIDRQLKIGYAVIAEDIDGDGLRDIVIVDQHQIVWYQNPGQRQMGWPKHLILDGRTRPDNVSITALDITGDGKLELVVGAGWKPFDTSIPGQLVWLRRGSDPTQPWSLHELPCEEPTVHRVRAFDLDGDGQAEIVHVPLMGRGATREGNWMDGRPLRVMAMKVPKEDPEKVESWKPFVLSEQLHVAHNFFEIPFAGFARPGRPILIANYEGIHMIYPEGVEDRWSTVLLHPALQTNPNASRGASEIKQSRDSRGLIATIEPWHGNQVVVYVAGKPDPEKAFSYDRLLIDDHLRWGHAVAFADLNRDGKDELIIGVRDDPQPNQGDDFSERRGVRIYASSDDQGRAWNRTMLDEGGVAVEDLTVADLDGDGHVDIIAVGRQTGNARIYWNLGSEGSN